MRIGGERGVKNGQGMQFQGGRRSILEACVCKGLKQYEITKQWVPQIQSLRLVPTYPDTSRGPPRDEGWDMEFMPSCPRGCTQGDAGMAAPSTWCLLNSPSGAEERSSGSTALAAIKEW